MRITLAWSVGVVAVGVAASWLVSDAGAQGAGAPAMPTLRLVVDPGHGGPDPGAVGAGGTEEKALTLAFAQRLQSALSGNPRFSVLLTRDADVPLSLDDRAVFANRAGADAFLSVHVNASPSPTTAGPEVATGSVDAVGVAGVGRSVFSTTLPLAGGGARGVVLAPWGAAHVRHEDRSLALAAGIADRFRLSGPLGPRGLHRARLRPLASVDAPSVFLELGYLTNAEEEQALLGEARQQVLVQGIIDALMAMSGGETR